MNEVQQLLLTSFSCSPHRQQAEQQLIQHLITNPQHFQQLGLLIIVQDQNYLQMATVLNATIKLMKSNQQLITQLYKQSLFEIYTNLNVPFYCKILIKSAIKIIFEEDTQYSHLFQECMFLYLKDQRSIILSIQIFRLLTDTIISADVVDQNKYSWYIDYIEQVSKIMNQSFNLENDSLIYFDFLECFEGMLFRFFKYDQQKYLFFQNFILQNQELSKLFINIFSFQSQNHFIQCQSNSTIQNAKILTLKCYKHIIIRMLSSRNKQQLQIFPIYQQLNQLILFLIQSLQITISEEVTIIILEILSTTINQIEFYNIYQNYYQQLIVTHLYSYLVYSSKQLSLLYNEPLDFIQQELSFDSQNKLQSLHNQTLDLIRALITHIDGAYSFLSSSAFVLFKYSINEILSNQLFIITEQEFNHIKLLQNNSIFYNFDSKQRLQISLLILIIIQPTLNTRYDIQEYLAIIIQNSYQVVLQCQDELIQILFTKLIGESYSILKSTVSQLFYKQFLENIVKLEQINKLALFYQQINTINLIVSSDELPGFIEKNKLFDEIIQKFSSQISCTCDIRILQMIEEWVSTYQFQQNTIQLIAQHLAQRIYQEQTNIYNNQINREIFIELSWNILHQIANHYNYFDYLLSVENQIVQLYKQVKDEESVQYTEKMIPFVSIIIQKLKRVTIDQISLLPKFERILQSQNYSFQSLFELLNNYMYFGREYFINETTQSIYFHLALSNIVSNLNSTLDKCEGALLIQLGIQCLRNDLNENILRQIFDHSYQIIKQSNTDELLASRIKCIFLSALLTIKSLSEKIIGTNQMQSIQQELYEMNYSAGYDAKLFIIYYSNAILQNPEILLTTGCNIVSMLSYQLEQQKEEKFESFDGCSSGSEDDEHCYENFTEEKRTLEEQVTKFKSGYVSVDEFETFKQAIYQLKAHHPNVIAQFKQGLHFFTSKKLQQMLSVTRAQYEQPRQMIKIAKRKNH
ncbi:unnamed protein product [Paramecium octaurelia]|uniref:Uncharacterized protein n=1 Tax=Paramecium octaurelia TaxID=43137 RepID=A0A8S1XX80_PAROT|nr:unnamed protein product [Paramecium octaurelia]